MIAEDLEFQISQYVDGTLSAAEMKYVDDLIQSDAQAQKVLAEYRRLNSHLAQLRIGPAMQWNRFAEQISHKIEKSDQPAVAGRIGFLQSRWRVAAAMLVAGSALIVARHALRPSAITAPVAPPSMSLVSGPQADVAKGPAAMDVSVGPSPALARGNLRYGEGVITGEPPKVVIQVGQLPPGKAPADSHLH